MTQMRKWIDFCLTLPGAYEDYPFDDDTAVMRLKENRKMFALICEHEGALWMNVKADPQAVELWLAMYPFTRPAYHMNKRHWVGLVLDEQADEEQAKRLIKESYALILPKKRS